MSTQKRLAITSSMLGAIKSIKMTGLTKAVRDKLSALRRKEIVDSEALRWILVAYNASANALGIFSPVLLLGIFAVSAKSTHSRLLHTTAVDTKAMFTTVAILAMVTHPANMIMTIIPRAVAAYASVQRIEDYLTEPERSARCGPLATADDCDSHVACLDKATFWVGPSNVVALEDISLTLKPGQTTVCIGIAGSGKTTLTKAILGEIECTSGHASLLYSRVGLCTQNPWLPGGTLRSAILGTDRETDMDVEWYQSVVRACCLNVDIISLENGDLTDIGSRGLNLSGGQRQRVALARALYSRPDIVVLDDTFSALDSKTETSILHNVFGPSGVLRNMTSTAALLITNKARHCSLGDHVVVLEASRLRGQPASSRLHVPQAILENVAEVTQNNHPNASGSDLKQQSQRSALNDAASDLARFTGDVALYKYYVQAMGSKNFSLLVGCTASYGFFITFPQYWLKWWTEADGQTWYYITGYFVIALIAWVSTNGTLWSTLIRIAPTSGLAMHSALLDTTLRTRLSYFFDTNAGTILNRFGQDIQLVDRELSSAIMTVAIQTFKLVVQVSVLLCVDKFMAAAIPLCLTVVYIVQKLYVRASRQLRFLDLDARAGVLSSFIDTCEGLATIRAFGWESKYAEQHNLLLDQSQQCWFLLLCLQRWLNVVLDLVVGSVAVGIIVLLVVLKTPTGAQIGVALNLVLVANTTLLRLVESWTMLEVSLGAVARIKTFNENTPTEGGYDEHIRPNVEWPSKGELKVEELQVSYRLNGVPALTNVNLTVHAGQFVVIRGRTGSGKSTLLLALLRLLDLDRGSIRVDGIDLSQVPRDIIRERCFVAIPQDGFVLPETSLRFTVDPFEAQSDAQVVAILKETQMWDSLQSLVSTTDKFSEKTAATGDILNISVASLPPFTPSQLQMLSLSRAILRTWNPAIGPSRSGRKPIILLDEVTSSLDVSTEKLVYKLLRTHFVDKGFAVIIISHQLGLVDDVLRKGLDVVVEIGAGKILDIIKV